MKAEDLVQDKYYMVVGGGRRKAVGGRQTDAVTVTVTVHDCCTTGL